MRHIRHEISTQKTAGFTLVEMMVAVAIFSMVAVISISALLALVDANRRSQALFSVVNNLNFAVEGMTRQMRTGAYYHCGSAGGVAQPQDCPGGDDYIAFEAYNGDRNDPSDQLVYRYNAAEDRIEKSTNGGMNFTPLTAPEVVVESFEVRVNGAPRTDDEQPTAVFLIEGYVDMGKGAHSEFHIQTSATQRVIDV